MDKLNYLEQQNALARAHRDLTNVRNSVTNTNIIQDLSIALKRIEFWMSKEEDGSFTFED